MSINTLCAFKSAASADDQPMTPELSPSKPAILVAEDDDNISYLLEFMLAREGYEVVLATDGRKAEQLIAEMAPPALVLLDVMLPFTDGYQLLAQIRAKPEWSATAVVMLTAKSQESDIVRALDAGANDYMVKPFQPNELIARVRRYQRKEP